MLHQNLYKVLLPMQMISNKIKTMQNNKNKKIKYYYLELQMFFQKTESQIFNKRNNIYKIKYNNNYLQIMMINLKKLELD